MTEYLRLTTRRRSSSDPEAGAVTAGRGVCQRAIDALVTDTVMQNGIGGGDLTAVHAETVGYRIIDALREHSLANTRSRRDRPGPASRRAR